MEGKSSFSDHLLLVDNKWEETTAQAIHNIEKRCYAAECEESSFEEISPVVFNARNHREKNKADQTFKSFSVLDGNHDNKRSLSDSEKECSFPSSSVAILGTAAAADDIRYIDDSAKSSSCTSDTIQICHPVVQKQHKVQQQPVERACASVLEERYCQAYLGPKNDSLVEKHNWHLVSQQIASGHHILPKKVKSERLVASPLPPVGDKVKQKTYSCRHCTETDCYIYVPPLDTETFDGNSLILERDFRYYFQHPYSRLFISYFVIFCNFLVFAEDPVSHSHTESIIPVVGNVFSFVATKYPSQWSWCVLKVFLWIIAIMSGMIFGKYLIHHVLLSRVFRLKMFRDEQGTWMIMFLTSLMFIYMFSLVYNIFLLAGHPNASDYRINSSMGITNATFMKCAACGTWIGDFITAWMVTDMMLQDNLYPEWAKLYRSFWQSHGKVRIGIFWTGSISMTTLVVTLIVSDWISWDYLNKDFVATTELSRAFLASFILVMDLLIVMQDWDFPHFVCDLDIKLPGMHVASFKFNLFKKYVHIPDVNIHVTGKWFNYSIIVFVMILDLNMWKNQIFYIPVDYGQYTGPDHKVFSISDSTVIAAGNISYWTYEYRNSAVDPLTNRTLLEGDISMNSRYLGYPLSVKSMAFMPSLIGFSMFGILTYMYGRFPPQVERIVTGHMRKQQRQIPRSSWRRERGTQCTHYILNSKDKQFEKKKLGRQIKEHVVTWDENLSPSKSFEKPL